MSHDPHQNPYAAGASVPSAAEPTSAETIRRKYLSHEASVQSIASLFLIGGVIGLLVSIGYFVVGFTALSGPIRRGAPEMFFVLAVVFLAFAVAQIGVAVGVRKLAAWSRVPATILSLIGLLGFPIGTLISIYFLYLLLSRKGEMVFSDEYRDVIKRTPRIKYRTSIVVWVVLFLILSMIVFLLVGATV